MDAGRCVFKTKAQLHRVVGKNHARTPSYLKTTCFNNPLQTYQKVRMRTLMSKPYQTHCVCMQLNIQTQKPNASSLRILQNSSPRALAEIIAKP